MAGPARATARSPTPEAARAPEVSRATGTPHPQFALRMSQPGDPAEREAERTADRVMAMPEGAATSRRVSLLPAPSPTPPRLAAAPAPTPRPAGAPPPRGGPAKPPPAAAVSAIRRRLEGAATPAGSGDMASPQAAAAIQGRLGGGVPLPAETRSFMEPRFGADLSRVRVHNDGKAQGIAADLGARALTYGRDIFFGPGEFQPDSREGKHLIAHELTHTVQQQGVVQREVTVAERSAPQVQRGLRSFVSGVASKVGGAIEGAVDAVGDAIGNVLQIVRDFVADKAAILPGFHLLCLVLGHNPINDAATPGGGQAILRELVGFIPFGDKIVEALENHGIIARGGAFIDQQIAGFKRVVASVVGAIGEFFGSLGPSDAVHPIKAWERAKAIFSSPIDEMKSFASGLITGFVDLVVDVILKPLGKWAAANIPHWDLLMAVLGKNPVSGEGESPASRVIGLFMNLIGQGEVWENIQKAKAIPRAWAWFQKALGGAKSLVVSIPGEVMATVKSLTIMDVLTIAGAFRKIVGAFASFVGKFIDWAGGTVLSLLEIILDVVAPAVVPYLKKAGGAFKTIVRNPIGFVRTLVAAGKLGFQQFASNFLTHLKAALIGWLTGALGGAGVYIPQGFSFTEILKFVLSVMGLTWANVRGKLVAATNETTVKALETGFEIVKTLVTEGPAAAWQQIMETLSNLKEMAIDAAMDFVKSKVVEAAVTKLLSMLSPAGAFIQAIIAIYNTIMFFVERLQQIAQVAAAFIDGIAAIAAGNIAPAAARVEKTMAGLLTLVISFLARLAGLGKVSDAILNLVKKIRDPIDKALDKVVAWIVAQAKKLGKMVADKVRGKDERTPEQKMADLQKAVAKIKPSVEGMLQKGVPGIVLRARFAAWKVQYRLTSLELDGHNIVATINPKLTIAEGWTYEDTDLFKIVDDIAAELVEEGAEENEGFEEVVIERTVTKKSGKSKRTTKKKVEGEQIDLTERQSIGAGAAAASKGGRQEFIVGEIKGDDTKMAAGHANEQTYRPAWPNIRGIGAGGLGGSRGHVYDKLAKELGDKPAGDWLALMTQNKPLPAAAAPYRPQLEELWTLMYAKEPSHNKGMHRRDLVYSGMVNELMTGPDGLTAKEAMGSKGIHPAAFAGAQSGAKSVTAEINEDAVAPKSTKGSRANKEERRRRERATLKAWFQQHLPAMKKEIPIQNKKPTLEQLKAFVLKHIKGFIGERKKSRRRKR